jgi:hypothetical protein
LDSSRLVDQFTRLSMSWNTGKKAAAMSTFCTRDVHTCVYRRFDLISRKQPMKLQEVLRRSC